MPGDDRRLRFAFLTQAWPDDPGAVLSGSSVQVYNIAGELASRGYPTLVVLSSVPTVEVRGKGMLELISIPGEKGLRGQLNGRWLASVESALRSFAPDVVYQRGKLPETVAAARYRARSNTKFFWVSNSDRSGERWKFVGSRLRKQEGGIRFLPRLAEAAYADLRIERAMRMADLVIAQTEHQQRRLSENFGLRSIRIGSGHPIPPLRRTSRPVPQVLWLANVTEVKRPWLFLELAERLRDRDVRFVMAGGAPNRALLDQVASAAQRLPNLSFVGRVPLDRANALMRDSDLFVMTSEYEGIPNTVVQACIHGVPTVSLNIDPDGIITSNRIGLVAEGMEELTARLTDLLDKPAVRLELGDNAYAYALAEFDVRSIVDRLLDVAVDTIDPRDI